VDYENEGKRVFEVHLGQAVIN